MVIVSHATPLAAEADAGRRWCESFDDPTVVERGWLEFAAAADDDRRVPLLQGLAFARARHEGQTRRGSATPFWVHPARVAMTLAGWGEGESDLLQAALLHDTVEDTATTVAEVEAGFGPRVAGLVDWLTCPADREGQRGYYRRLEREAPGPVRALKLADRTDNLDSLLALLNRDGVRHLPWAEAYLARTEWQVVPVADGAPATAAAALADALERLGDAVAWARGVARPPIHKVPAKSGEKP
jgi:guanosine-3',5'-bis(diphosphate) 3'-pyrophosphohydrolase